MISHRIKEIATFSKNYKRIADIGCDHGFLIIEAFENYDIEYAQAIDNKKGPLDSAKRNISKFEFSKNVDFTLSDGLEKITEVDAIFICGMGGNLICDIISKNLDKIVSQVLIMQPNRNSYELRRFLMENSFEMINEKIIHDEFYYEVIVAVKSTKRDYSLKELMFGPINLKNKTNAFKNKLLRELKGLNEIEVKGDKINEKITMIEEILNTF